MHAEILRAVGRLVVVVGRRGIDAGDGERTGKVVRKKQGHSFGGGRRIFGHYLVPHNAALVVKLELAVVLERAVVTAEAHRERPVRIVVGREYEGSAAIRIRPDGGDGGVRTETGALRT